MASEGPPLGRRIWFWVILGMSSTFFAEVTVGSQPFPFFDPFSILVVVPLYTLHILVLATVVVRGRKVTLGALFVAGIVFGLYEAYITKVIWDPYWEFVTTIHLAEVAVIQTAILILWYHNFFAFIIPLAFSETLCTGSRKVLSCLPGFVTTRLAPDRLAKTMIVLGVVFGMFQAAANHGPAVSFVSIGGSGLVLFAACHMFNIRGHGRVWTIDELLPSQKQFRVLLGALLAFYAVMTVGLLPENLPGVAGHAAVLAMYAGAFLLLRRVLRAAGAETAVLSSTTAASVGIPAERVLLWLSVYCATATLMGFAVVVAAIFALSVHICGVGLGSLILIRTIRRAALKDVEHNA